MPRKTTSNHPLAKIRVAISKRFELNQITLAHMLDCSRDYIQRVESGKQQLSRSVARRIDVLLGTDLVSWVDSGSDPCKYEIDEEEIQKRFIERQFVEDLDFKSRKLKMDVSFSGIQEYAKETYTEGGKRYAFSAKSMKCLFPVITEFEKRLESALAELGVEEKHIDEAIGTILDDMSSGRTIFLSTQELWNAAKETKQQLEIVWETRQWLIGLNEKYGLNINIGRLFPREHSSMAREAALYGDVIPDGRMTPEGEFIPDEGNEDRGEYQPRFRKISRNARLQE